MHCRQVKNELDTLLRLKANIVDSNSDILNDQHQKIILRDNYLKSLVENKTYTPKIIGIENPEIKVNNSKKSKFIPIPVPSNPIPQQQDIQTQTFTLGNAVHKKTNEPLKVLSKLDDNHYFIMRKDGHKEIINTKNMINFNCSQVAK